MPRQTNADKILSEARARLAAAEKEERDAETELRLATAAVLAHQANVDALEKALAPKPRKKAEPKPVTTTKEAEKKIPKCGICYEIKDHSNHDMTYSSSHEFDWPKSAKKSRKAADVESENAASVGAGGD